MKTSLKFPNCDFVRACQLWFSDSTCFVRNVFKIFLQLKQGADKGVHHAQLLWFIGFLPFVWWQALCPAFEKSYKHVYLLVLQLHVQTSFFQAYTPLFKMVRPKTRHLFVEIILNCRSFISPQWPPHPQMYQNDISMAEQMTVELDDCIVLQDFQSLWFNPL